MPCKSKIKNGFTLLEIILSTVLVLVLASGVVSSGSYLKVASLRLDEKEVAMHYMEKKLAEYKALTPAQFKSKPTGATTSSNMPQLGAGKLYEQFDLLETDTNCRKIDMRVEWNDPQGHKQTQFLSSVIYVG